MRKDAEALGFLVLGAGVMLAKWVAKKVAEEEAEIRRLGQRSAEELVLAEAELAVWQAQNEILASTSAAEVSFPDALVLSMEKIPEGFSLNVLTGEGERRLLDADMGVVGGGSEESREMTFRLVGESDFEMEEAVAGVVGKSVQITYVLEREPQVHATSLSIRSGETQIYLGS